MTITQLTYFVEIAKTENLRKASENLFVSQQALSRQIQALEKDIDVLLFERKKQRLYLTEAGKYLYSVWAPMLEENDRALNHARMIGKTKKIRVGVVKLPEIVDHVCKAIERYKQIKSETDIEVLIEGSNHLIQLFQEEKVDIIIVASVELKYINAHYKKMKLKSLELGAICNKNHRFEKGKKLFLSDLTEEELFVFEDDYIIHAEQNIRCDFEKAGIVPKKCRKVRDWENMELAIRMGQGIGITFKDFLPKYMDDILKFCPIAEIDSDNCQLMACWREEWQEEFCNMIKMDMSR